MKKISQKELDNLIKIRIESLKELPDSSGDSQAEDQADLDFLLAKLLHATLTNARMSGADLGRARLIGANLSGADLSKADLMGANLCKANLSGTNLSEARLIFSYLMGANLGGANLNNADLRGAKYDQTTIWPDGFDPIAAGAILNKMVSKHE
jgi:uncharacterized protein YjbI with pentapeptide repeats